MITVVDKVNSVQASLSRIFTWMGKQLFWWQYFLYKKNVVVAVVYVLLLFHSVLVRMLQCLFLPLGGARVRCFLPHIKTVKTDYFSVTVYFVGGPTSPSITCSVSFSLHFPERFQQLQERHIIKLFSPRPVDTEYSACKSYYSGVQLLIIFSID